MIFLFVFMNEPDTQYVPTLMVREDGEQGIGKRGCRGRYR